MECLHEIEGYKVYRYIMPAIESNMYVLPLKDKALVIDPCRDEEAIDLLKQKGIKDIVIILTHEHCDHISGVNLFRENFSCVVYGNNKCKERVVNPSKNLAAFFMGLFIDKSEEKRALAMSVLEPDYRCEVDTGFDGVYEMCLDDLNITMTETPGHCCGSICIEVNDKYIFSGDCIIPGEDVVLNLPTGSRKDWNEKTVPYLMSLPDGMIVYPGHGEETTIALYKKEQLERDALKKRK